MNFEIIHQLQYQCRGGVNTAHVATKLSVKLMLHLNVKQCTTLKIIDSDNSITQLCDSLDSVVTCL